MFEGEKGRVCGGESWGEGEESERSSERLSGRAHRTWSAE